MSNENSGFETVKNIFDDSEIAIPGTNLRFNAAAAAVGFVVGGDVLAGAVSGLAVPYLLGMGQSENSDGDQGESDPPDGGDEGGGGDDPDPGSGGGGADPDPGDGGQDPEPLTVKEALALYSGPWSESGNGAYIRVNESGRFVTFTGVYDGKTVPLTFGEVRQLSPNNVRFSGISRQTLSDECLMTYGLSFYDLVEEGHPQIDDFVFGFYLYELLDRDNVVSGLPAFVGFGNYVDTAIVGIDFHYEEGSSYNNSLGSSFDGDYWETREVGATFSISAGHSGSRDGLTSTFDTVGQLIRAMIGAEKFYWRQGRSITYAPVNRWGNAPQQHYVSISADATVLSFIKACLEAGGISSGFATLEEACLYYIDHPQERDAWDACAIIGFERVVRYEYNSAVPPFIHGDDHYIP